MSLAFDPASGSCAGHSQPGAKALMRWALDEYPTASNLGIYVCRNVRGGRSKSVHADGRAGDTAFPVDEDGSANTLGHDYAALLVINAERLGIQLVIFDQMIWSSKTQAWKAHCGHDGARGPHGNCSGPHFDHVHWELTWDAARGLTREEIVRILGPPTPASEDDMPLTADDVEKVAQRVKALLMGDDALGPVRHHVAGSADQGARLPRALRDLAAVKEAHGLTD